jgi:hypothetical protein
VLRQAVERALVERDAHLERSAAGLLSSTT